MSLMIADGALGHDGCRSVPYRDPVLVCGRGSRAAFSNSDDPPAYVSGLVIDPIADPLVLIQFSSVIEFLASFTGQTGGLRFDLYRAIDYKTRQRLGAWNYELTGLEGNPGDFEAPRFIKSFDFVYCDFPPCRGCLEYFVQVSPFNVYAATMTVDNVHMTALVQ